MSQYARRQSEPQRETRMTESLRLKKIETPVLNTARPSEDSLDGWKSQLVDVGYIIIPNALPAPAVDHFRERVASFEPSVGYGSASLVRLFEKGKDFVDLLLNEPIFSLM